jgi:hypothetical protein
VLTHDRIVLAEFELLRRRPGIFLGDVIEPGPGGTHQFDQNGIGLGHARITSLGSGASARAAVTIRPRAPLSRYRSERQLGDQRLAALQVCVQAMIVDQAAGDFQIDGAVPPLLGRTPGIGFLLVRPDGTA